MMNKMVYFFIAVGMLAQACQNKPGELQVDIFETSAAGNKLTPMGDAEVAAHQVDLIIYPDQTHQTIIGFGGSFTESSAYLLNQLGQSNRDTILKAYFGNDGAKYSLTRTHINSCDFSLSNYAYVPNQPDTTLSTFSIDPDRDDIIPMIKDAATISEDGFKIISSPWTAPPG